MSNVMTILGRELRSYFATPLGYIFIIFFLLAVNIFTFQLNNFFAIGQASIGQFFFWHMIWYLIFIPLVTMRLWAEERKSGTIELLLTLPVTSTQAILGKFFAAWIFLGITLILTFPMLHTVALLGDPDDGAVIGNYLGTFLMSGSMLAIGICMSAISKNQVISGILAAAVCVTFVLTGLPKVLDFLYGWAPEFIVDGMTTFSIYTHFSVFQNGVIGMSNVLFFLSLIVGWLIACGVIIDMKKSD